MTKKQATIVYTHQDAKAIVNKGKIFTQESKTVPDQTMSIRQIMQRHVRGIETPVAKVPIYTESDGINAKNLDLVDIQEIKMEMQERIDNVEKAYAKAKEKKNYDKALKDAEKALTEASKQENQTKKPEGQ